MTTPQRALIDEFILKIQVEIDEAQEWAFHRYQPIHHAGDGDHCAVWFQGFVEHPGGNTSTSLGNLDTTETYHVQFWRPAPEGAQVVIDEEAGEDVERLFIAVEDVLMGKQTGPEQYWVHLVAGEVQIGGVNEPKTRGFEFVLNASRAIAWSV